MKFNWIKFEQNENHFAHYKIPNQTLGNESFLTVVYQEPIFHPKFPGQWTGQIVTSDNALWDIPFFETSEQACICAEMYLSFNRSLDEWLKIRDSEVKNE